MVFVVVVLVVFAARMADYILGPDSIQPAHLVDDVKQTFDRAVFALKAQPLFNSCPNGSDMVDDPGGYVCAPPGHHVSAWDAIYRDSPIDGGAMDAVYSSTDAGTMANANDMLHNLIPVPRYRLWNSHGHITWSEDPYDAPYWRFNFYSLRPTQDLLYAYRTTGDVRYAKALIRIDNSFFSAESTSPYAWVDDHAVAFRAMVLVDSWWRLRQGHVLSQAESTRFLEEIHKSGIYLADPNHYQQGENHAVNEAAALLQIGVDFPHMPDAPAWHQLGTTRLNWSIDGIVDPNGVLIENSPYYEFYVLDKLWQIREWAQSTHVSLQSDFNMQIAKMINYATYILQPNSSVPLLGASLETTIKDHGTFAQMAATNPSFAYALTHGAKGSVPPHTSTRFPDSGETIMRSGWGSGANFSQQSYLTFNVGPYRTTHSDLDALGITLYGNGKTLLPGAGLYTYQLGAMRTYFHGTMSHNTVVVDGQDQAEGSATAGKFVQEDGITYQTGESSLYQGVIHRRTVIMLDQDHYLVVDRLTSSTPHTYQQMWHLFPGAKLSTKGLTVTGSGTSANQSLTIRQIQTSGVTESSVTGQTNPPAGICSEHYTVLESCPQIAYAEHGTDAQFTTLLTIGHSGAPVAITHRSADVLDVRDGSRTITIGLTTSKAVPEVAKGSHTHVPTTRSAVPVGALVPAAWKVAGGPPAQPLPQSYTALGQGIMLTTTGSTPETATLLNSTYDGAHRTIELRIKVSAVEDLANLDVELSNNNWTTVMSNDVRNAYDDTSDGEWLGISLGRGQALSGNVGHWQQNGPGTFDWSKIDGVRLRLQGKSDSTVPVTVELSQLDSVPEQSGGKVVIIFDDGYQSVLPAANYLHHLGLRANVAVIAKYVDLPSMDHLNVHQLRFLQNRWGWNMVNHTLNHVDGVAIYSDTGNLTGYEADVAAGAQFLESAGLNSAPDWFVYPHGDADNALKSVLGHMYKFARVTDDEPQSYPFDDPLAVNTLEIHIASDSETGSESGVDVTTTPAQVDEAVQDAKRFGNTLILTFHRIHASASDPPGYPIKDFKEIANDLKASGIRVMTLSQLDRSNGVKENNHITVVPARPSQTVVHLSVHGPQTSPSLWSKLTGWL